MRRLTGAGQDRVQVQGLMGYVALGNESPFEVCWVRLWDGLGMKLLVGWLGQQIGLLLLLPHLHALVAMLLSPRICLCLVGFWFLGAWFGVPVWASSSDLFALPCCAVLCCAVLCGVRKQSTLQCSAG